MKNFFFALAFGLSISFSHAQNSQITSIDQMLDRWHLAATNADEEMFFGLMTEDAHYLGTDASEDWTRDQMKVWAKSIFEKDSAWDFKKIKRNIYNYNEELAWFDETLDTWMGICRGSGVVKKVNGDWKIQHYVLSVAVPNDKIDAYLQFK